jgi:homoserine kinase type II
MAIYTPILEADLREFLTHYNVGELAGFEGIAEGVSNTNYLLITSHESRTTNYILTLFESTTKLEDLPYFVALMAWWSARGIHCPTPVKMNNGRTLAVLAERPALMVSFLDGEGVRKITLEHMAQLGRLAAKMHVEGMGFPHTRANALSVDAWGGMALDVRSRADEIEVGLADFIRDEVNFLSEHWPQGLPSGPIHADLFPDNVFFSKSFGKAPVLSGVIDFYYACNDAWAYDLAICVNAWCFDDRYRLVPERVQALMAGYNDVRPMTDEETRAFPLLLRGAALRFLLTRTRDWLAGKGDAIITLKDPPEYMKKLEYWQQLKQGLTF